MLDAAQRNKTSFVFRSGDERVPLRYAPGFFGHGYTINADVIIPPDGAEGVILADGGELGGLSLFVKNNHVYYEVNASNEHSDQLVATQTLRPGLQHGPAREDDVPPALAVLGDEEFEPLADVVMEVGPEP